MKYFWLGIYIYNIYEMDNHGGSVIPNCLPLLGCHVSYKMVDIMERPFENGQHCTNIIKLNSVVWDVYIL